MGHVFTGFHRTHGQGEAVGPALQREEASIGAIVSFKAQICVLPTHVSQAVVPTCQGHLYNPLPTSNYILGSHSIPHVISQEKTVNKHEFSTFFFLL